MASMSHRPGQGVRASKGPFLSWGLLGLLLFMGILVRVYGAWLLRHHLNPDAGIVALMAKHIVELRELPVFFYGQAYMGSLEAYTSALWCLLFGTSGFWVGMGTVLFSVLLLPLVYAWGRDAGGDRFAGLMALAWCVVGPHGFFHYNVSPRGGYALTLLLTSFILWYGTRIVHRRMDGVPVSVGSFLLLGLCAGVGWWTNQLIAGALAAAAAIFAVFLRGALWDKRLLAGGAGFLAGSLPFWVYNVTRGWPTFVFRETLGQVPFRKALGWFFHDRLLMLLGLDQVPRWARHLGAGALWTGLLIAAIVAVLCWRKRKMLQALQLTALALFFLFSGLLFASSHFAALPTPRYLLPLVPALAVLMGAAAAACRHPVYRVAACLVLAGWLYHQHAGLVWAQRFSAREERAQARIESLRTKAGELGLDAFYAPYLRHGWNFALGEALTFSDIGRERYRPYAQHLEEAESFGVIDNFHDIEGFVRLAGGSVACLDHKGIRVHYDLRPPANGLEPILPETWAFARDSQGRDLREHLAAPWYDRGWRSLPPPAPDWIEIGFHEPVMLGGLRMVCGAWHEYPLYWRLEVLTREEGWIEAVPESHINLYFWSGDRAYPGGRHYRLQVRLEPVEVLGLRLHHGTDRPHWWWSPRWLQVLSPGGPAESEVGALAALVELLAVRDISALYCDRYVANAVARATGGGVATPRDASLFPGEPHLPASIDPARPGMALLCRREDAALMRECLRKVTMEARETPVGPWLLFDALTPAPDSGGSSSSTALRWVGFAPLLEQWREPRDSARADPAYTPAPPAFRPPSVTAWGSHFSGWISNRAKYGPERPCMSVTAGPVRLMSP